MLFRELPVTLRIFYLCSLPNHCLRHLGNDFILHLPLKCLGMNHAVPKFDYVSYEFSVLTLSLWQA